MKIWTPQFRISPALTAHKRLARSLILLAILTAASYTVLAQIPLEQRQYRIVKLDGLGGNSGGTSVNNRGWVMGSSNDAANQITQAVIWVNSELKPLGTFGGPNSAIVFPVKNNRGIVSGVAETNQKHPFNEVWSCNAFFVGDPSFNVCVGFRWENDVMTPLPVFPGGYNGFASAANNQGQIVGWAENGVHDPTCVAPQVLQFRAALWGPKGDQMSELSPLYNDSTSAATAINDKGQIVGISGACGSAVGAFSAKHMVLWEDGKATEIPNLGGVAWNTPTAINEQGTVVGFSNYQASDGGTFNEHAFVWTKESGTKEILPINDPGGQDTRSQALGINSRGQIVGLSRRGSVRRAFLYENGTALDLNKFVMPGFADVLRFANDINEKGEITGQARSASGEFYAFLAIPVIK